MLKSSFELVVHGTPWNDTVAEFWWLCWACISSVVSPDLSLLLGYSLAARHFPLHHTSGDDRVTSRQICTTRGLELSHQRRLCRVPGVDPSCFAREERPSAAAPPYLSWGGTSGCPCDGAQDMAGVSKRHNKGRRKAEQSVGPGSYPKETHGSWFRCSLTPHLQQPTGSTAHTPPPAPKLCITTLLPIPKSHTKHSTTSPFILYLWASQLKKKSVAKASKQQK